MKIESFLDKLSFRAMQEDYSALEQDTLEIIYPTGEELPLVADKRVMDARRADRNALLNETLVARRSNFSQ